jgi:hypothetical protein
MSPLPMKALSKSFECLFKTFRTSSTRQQAASKKSQHFFIRCLTTSTIARTSEIKSQPRQESLGLYTMNQRYPDRWLSQLHHMETKSLPHKNPRCNNIYTTSIHLPKTKCLQGECSHTSHGNNERPDFVGAGSTSVFSSRRLNSVRSCTGGLDCRAVGDGQGVDGNRCVVGWDMGRRGSGSLLA